MPKWLFAVMWTFTITTRAISCDRLMANFQDRFGHWHKVDMERGVIKETSEVEAVADKSAAIYLRDERSNLQEIIEGRLQRFPSHKYQAYDVRLRDGSTRPIRNLEAVREIRVYKPQTAVSHESFLATYGTWSAVELQKGTGLPKDETLYVALRNRQLAIYLEDTLSFDYKEVVTGELLQVSFGAGDSSYDLRLADGSIIQVENLSAVREVRVAPATSPMR
jgi:hypothetical protein